ncbi:uncharacterized protein ACRADG_000976 isoform 1-T1 [Cochliomyia hominivorax]
MDIISSNIYIFYEIFDYLNLKELLEAAKVCSSFRDVVIKILQIKYKQVQGFKTSHYYIVSNNVDKEHDLNLFSESNSKILLPKRENRILLSHGEFLDFLQLNSNNIENLLLHFNDEYSANIQSSYYDDREYLCKLKFDQLKKLGIEMNVTELQINGIINNCPNLKELYCSGILCENSEYYDTIGFIHIPVNTLDHNKIIKCLGCVDVFLIDGYDTHRDERFIRLEHLVNEYKKTTNLLNLIIENNTQPNNLETKINKLNVCEILTQGQMISQRIYDVFNRKIFRNLINLRKLTIVGSHLIDVTKDLFINLNDRCKHFEYLELEYCTINEYIPITTLKELTLFNCFGLSTKDLVTILSHQTNMKTFSSTLVVYKGDYREHFNISENLQHLKLRYNDINDNVMPLLELKYLNSLHFSSLKQSKQYWINSNNCLNLEILEVTTNHLIINEINEFKYLKQLILNIKENLNANQFWHILQNPMLIYLTLNDNPEVHFMNYETFLKVQIETGYNWKINIQYIDVCFNNIGEHFFDFWLKLLSENVNLTLRIKYGCLREEYDYNEDECTRILRNILENPRRPSNLKTINVCGYDLDLINIGQNLDETLEDVTLISQDNHFNNKLQYILLKNSK